MASIHDWAAKCAEYINSLSPRPKTERIAAIIATFAEPLVALLREARRSDHEAGCMAGWAQVGVIYDDTRCSCSVGVWNAKIDAALAGNPTNEAGPGGPNAGRGRGKPSPGSRRRS